MGFVLKFMPMGPSGRAAVRADDLGNLREVGYDFQSLFGLGKKS
jgi:hypothetical protein